MWFQIFYFLREQKEKGDFRETVISGQVSHRSVKVGDFLHLVLPLSVVGCLFCLSCVSVGLFVVSCQMSVVKC